VTDDALVVRGDLSGIDPDTDLEITVTDCCLHRASGPTTSRRLTGKASSRSGYRRGQRLFALQRPSRAVASDATGAIHDGLA
jgi:hypothetical protein